MSGEREKIKVLIVDDSPLWAETLAEVLEGDPRLEVLDIASDGARGVEATARMRPDVVIMDVLMPVLGGLDAVSRIMARCPTPIVVMTADPRGNSGELTLDALRRGALDLIVKDAAYPPPPDFVARLRTKVRLAAGVRVVRHIDPEKLEAEPVQRSRSRARILGLAASTGGPAALATIFERLPADFPSPILVVQHLASGFTESFTDWLDSQSALSVRIAASGERATPGRIYIAPDGKHLEVMSDGYLRLHQEEPVNGHRPSGDLLFESLSQAYGISALGAVLTGMGDDGARGLSALRRAGGQTMAQDRETSVIFGMPQAADKLGAVERFVSLDAMAGAFCELAGSPSPPLEKTSSPNLLGAIF